MALDHKPLRRAMRLIFSLSSVASRGRVSEPAATPDLLDTPDAGPAAIRGGAVRIVGYLAGVAVSVFASALLLRHLGS